MSLSLTNKQINELTSHLMGSCYNLGEIVMQMFGIDSDGLSAETLQQIDDQVLLCDGCGLWVEPNELDEYYMCEDCKDE